MFFTGWMALIRTIVVGVSAYAALIVLLRISGKRTLSKMNAFDFVVTVALGSTLATILLAPEVALAQGVLALALLILLQFIMTWLSIRSKAVRHLIKSEPTLLFYNDEFLRGAMRVERVNEEEILQAMRSQGVGGPEQVEAVVLETDGTLSIIKKTTDDSPAALTSIASIAERVERNKRHNG